MGKILMGSQYFFSCYEDFQGKDVDYVQVITTNEFAQVKQLTGRGKCIFSLKKHEKVDDYIDWALRSQTGMVIGKFLVPEFCEEIGFTIEDLPKLYLLIGRLDDKHKYEEIIYNSYIQNNAFILTDEQRLEAYKSYKKSRGE